jgi:uncharacterized membrane protein YfcA
MPYGWSMLAESFLPFIILILIIVIGIFAIPAIRAKQKEIERTGKYPKGHYMGLGIAMGIPIGLPLGIAIDNIALGPAFGLAIGVAIGGMLEKKHAHELRPLTKKEKEVKQKTMWLLLLTVLAGLVAFVGVYFVSGL